MRRLVQEFVQEPVYEQKAMVMLEESLSQELRGSPTARLDDAHRVAVMYAGEIVEIAPRARFFGAAAHPYSAKLFEALPGGACPPPRDRRG